MQPTSVHFYADSSHRPLNELVKRKERKKKKLSKWAWIALWGPAGLLTPQRTANVCSSFLSRLFCKGSSREHREWQHELKDEREGVGYTEVPGQHCHPSVKASSCQVPESKGKGTCVSSLFCFHRVPCAGCHGPELPWSLVCTEPVPAQCGFSPLCSEWLISVPYRGIASTREPLDLSGRTWRGRSWQGPARENLITLQRPWPMQSWPASIGYEGSLKMRVLHSWCVGKFSTENVT